MALPLVHSLPHCGARASHANGVFCTTETGAELAMARTEHVKRRDSSKLTTNWILGFQWRHWQARLILTWSSPYFNGVTETQNFIFSHRWSPEARNARALHCWKEGRTDRGISTWTGTAESWIARKFEWILLWRLPHSSFVLPRATSS